MFARRTDTTWKRSGSPPGLTRSNRTHPTPGLRRFDCRVLGFEQTEECPRFQRELDENDQQEAEERSAISAKVVPEAIRLRGVEELERPPSASAWSGLAAGCRWVSRGLQRACCQRRCRTRHGGL